LFYYYLYKKKKKNGRFTRWYNIFYKMFQPLDFEVFLKIFERYFILDQSQLCISTGLEAIACQSEGSFAKMLIFHRDYETEIR